MLGVYYDASRTFTDDCLREDTATETDADVTDVFINSGNLAVGSNTGEHLLDRPRSRLLVAATVEPDADGDGFGDSTQDRCPSQPATQGLCRFELDNLGAPTGTAKVGRRLSAPRLVDPPRGTAQSFQWFRYAKAKKAYKPIAGARAASYVVTRKDRRTRVLVRITLRKSGYATETMSSQPRRVG